MNYPDFGVRARPPRTTIHYDPVTPHDISRTGDETSQSYKHLATLDAAKMHRPIDAHVATKKGRRAFINNYGGMSNK